MSHRGVFIDANILVMTWTTDVLLTIAEKGLFEPHWSKTVLAEAERAIRKVHLDDTDRPRKQLEIIDEAFPLAMTQINDSDLEGIELPDPDDCHIVAGARAAECDTIVTYNLKDFPAELTAKHGIRTLHPDTFLTNLANDAPDTVINAVQSLVKEKRRPPRSMEEEIRGLRANKLQDFADFIEARIG